MPIFMKYDGIDGAVDEQGHKKWIELESCQVGVHRNVRSASGSAANREASVASVGEVVVTKHQDCASAKLFRASLDGMGKKAEIHFLKVEQNKAKEFMKLELENAMISSYTVSGAGGDNHSRPMESLAINFTKITFHTIAADSKNAAGTADRAFYDLTQQKAG